MKANELRIGNLVQPISGNFESSKMWNKSEESLFINNNCVRITAEGLTDIEDDFIKIKPIPLTEEWLAKFGANLLPWGWVIFDVLIRTNRKGRFFIELGNGKRIDLPYVHTFQNFMSLTGNELTIAP